MTRLRLPVFLVFLAFIATRIHAQVDTTVIMEELLIEAKSIRQSSVGGQVQDWNFAEIDKLPSGMPDILQAEAGIYMKSYGLGSLASSSIRGGSAGHTLVLWNGLPLQSPMLGLLDLSLLAVQSFEEIRLEKGGQSALWGSGAIGGVLSLRNKQIHDGLLIKLHTSLGSFGQQQQMGTVGFALGKIYVNTKVNHETAANDFKYTVGRDPELRQQTNAQINKLNLHQDVYLQLNKHSTLALHYWYQIADRQIPPTTVQSFSEAYQDDKSNRLLIDWKRLTDTDRLNVKVGSITEELNYTDPIIGLESPSRFLNFFSEVNYESLQRTSDRLIFGLNHQYTQAEAAGYQNRIVENKTALFSSYKWSTSSLDLQASLRQEVVNGDLVPIIPAIGFCLLITDTWQWRAKLSRNFRLPTLNDRFWQPGGNATLKPEAGWSQEMSFAYHQNEKAQDYNMSLTCFSRRINDWILWAIPDGQASFSAYNISKVWSRGLEARLSYEQTRSKMNITFKGGYDFIKSTNEVSIEQPKLNKGDQLIYTPIHQGFISAQVRWTSFSLRYNHQAVGQVTGINEDISGYHIGNMHLQSNHHLIKLNKRKSTGELYLSIHNLWNVTYRVIERRAMPGRYFIAGIKLNIK